MATSKSFDSTFTSHFLRFEEDYSSSRHFDVSPCATSEDKRVFLKFTLEVEYGRLLHFSLESARDALKSAIAGLCGISPLRVADIHLSPSSEVNEGDEAEDSLDVWFVLLERPPTVDLRTHKAKSKTLADANRDLGVLVSKQDVDLDLGHGVIAQIRRHSLQTTTGAKNRKANRNRHALLRASYTAGSMAGLGFSMVILGVCVGVFVGFVLWKRRLGLPPNYMLHPGEAVS